MTTMHVSALDPSVYATESVLASGRWIKISVTSTGFHYLSPSLLKKWGFNNPNEVRLFGYGCETTDEILQASTFVDDLPEQPMMKVDGGIIFFASGPSHATLDKNNNPAIVNHPYSSKGYYFLTDGKSTDKAFATRQKLTDVSTDAEIYAVSWHENDIQSPGSTGRLIVGEDFKLTPIRSFTINMPGVAIGSTARLSTPFVAKTSGGTSTLSVEADGTQLDGGQSYVIPATYDLQYGFGNMITPTVDMPVKSNRTKLKLTLTPAGQLISANLDYIAAAYKVNAPADADNLIFFSKGGKIDSYPGYLFDITDSDDIRIVDDNILETSATPRCYQHISNLKKLPVPVLEAVTGNQNIHADMSAPDMIIVTPDLFKRQAALLADLHATENLKVTVLSSELIYNEFSSGRFDPSAIRKCLKMYYDRGLSAGSPLKYVLLFGRGIHDNRCVTSDCRSIKYPLLPTWQSETSLSDALSFTTDDFFGILGDMSGRDMAYDTLSVAVGRVAPTSVTDARDIVDKISEYVKNSPSGQWKTRALILADDGDLGRHLGYAEDMIEQMKRKRPGSDIMYSRIYLDTFKKTNGTYPDARKKLDTKLNSGVGWWTFIGHAGPTSLTAERLLTYNDIINLDLKVTPAIIAFTCDFLRCDQPSISGAEMLLNNRYGGVIAAISATRPANLSQNGTLAKSFGDFIYQTDKDGKPLPIGEIFRRAKNGYSSDGRLIANENKLRYLLLGDPAMRIASVNDHINISSINGIEPQIETPPSAGASSRVIIEGNIATPDSIVIDSFNGTVYTHIYDATESVTTNGNGSDGVKSVYDTEGQLLYAGTDTVINGYFRSQCILPAEIADNYRNATISQYAIDGTTGNEAAGIETRFYVYGRGETVPDTIAPTIDEMYLNHPSFKPGSTVNQSPVAYIRISDNTAVDISTTGIGNRMTLKLDDKPLTDPSLHYSPLASSGESGLITYQLESLADGYHTLTFGVSDMAGNRVERTIDFIVENGYKPHIFDIYTDSSPATDKANFYIVHDRPDVTIEAVIEIFDLSGRFVWSASRRGRSEMFTSMPVTWNLTDTGGRRVDRGIYIYRCTILTADGSRSDSRAKKIAVSSR